MTSTQKNIKSDVIEFRPLVMKGLRDIEINRKEKTIAMPTRFDDILFEQKRLTLSLPYNSKKIEVLKDVGKFIAQNENITTALIDFLAQIEESKTVMLTLHDWDNLEIVYFGASLEGSYPEFKNPGNMFLDYKAICADLADFIDFEIDKFNQ
jgi:hypothetical protein